MAGSRAEPRKAVHVIFAVHSGDRPQELQCTNTCSADLGQGLQGAAAKPYTRPITP